MTNRSIMNALSESVAVAIHTRGLIAPRREPEPKSWLAKQSWALALGSAATRVAPSPWTVLWCIAVVSVAGAIALVLGVSMHSLHLARAHPSALERAGLSWSDAAMYHFGVRAGEEWETMKPINTVFILMTLLLVGAAAAYILLQPTVEYLVATAMRVLLAALVVVYGLVFVVFILNLIHG